MNTHVVCYTSFRTVRYEASRRETVRSRRSKPHAEGTLPFSQTADCLACPPKTWLLRLALILPAGIVFLTVETEKQKHLTPRRDGISPDKHEPSEE